MYAAISQPLAGNYAWFVMFADKSASFDCCFCRLKDLFAQWLDEDKSII
jgi:hypothetical protein